MLTFMKRLSVKCAFRAAIVIASVCLVLACSSSQVSAGDFFKIVGGWIWQGDSSNPVEGATVLVQILTGAQVLLYSAPLQTTLSDGWYSVTIGATQWNISEVIKVTASYDGDQKTNSTTITQGGVAKPFEYVNVTFPTAIPQIVGPIGTLLAGGALGFVAVVALRRKPNSFE